MITHVAGVQLPDQVIVALADGEREEAAERRAREAAIADWQDRCERAAPLARAAAEAALVRGEAEAARADSEARRARERRATELEDHRADLIRSGRRWRTVGEILADARGDPT